MVISQAYQKAAALNLLAVFTLSCQTAPQPMLSKNLITLDKSDGGSIVTVLMRGIAVNKNSTLTRRWFTLNDNSCPILLEGAGVKSAYTSERYSGSYSFTPSGVARARKAVRATRIVFAIFDVWGDHMRNLALSKMQDIPDGGNVPFEGAWYASENDVSEYYTSAAFVDRVMLADGTIWRSDRKAISSKLSDVQIHVSEAGLEKEPPPKEGKKQE